MQGSLGTGPASRRRAMAPAGPPSRSAGRDVTHPARTMGERGSVPTGAADGNSIA